MQASHTLACLTGEVGAGAAMLWVGLVGDNGEMSCSKNKCFNSFIMAKNSAC